MRPSYDNYLTRRKLQETSSEKDLKVDVLPSLPSEDLIRIIKEVNYILVDVKSNFKNIHKEMFRIYIQDILASKQIKQQ